jgi:histidine triad (HIT) family protein
MSDCVFCRIADGSEPASVVSETTTTVAFLDITPMTPGHLLIVPREHAAVLAELDPDVGAELFREAIRIAAGVERAGLRVEGINLFLSDQEPAGQDIPHTHLHVVPRFEGDGVEIEARFGHPSREELDGQASRIRDALALPPGPIG